MEHLRSSQIENYENETFSALTQRLSKHATKLLERVQTSTYNISQSFQTDSNAIIETRFFRSLLGPGEQYELREEGLTLALGFTLVDQLWQTLSTRQDLAKRVIQLIEPINAMDRTADVLFASLLICALDDIRFDKQIFSVLLDAFASLQNIDDRRFEEFVEIVKHQPKAFFDCLKKLCLERGRRNNQDWFSHAAFEITHSDTGWQAAETALHQWLYCYNKDPAEQISRYPRRSESEYKKQLNSKKSGIEEVLYSLSASAFEKQLLERMTEVSSDLDELFTLALKLLAGRSLVGFADSFVAMGLAFSLDSHLHSAREAFHQLTTFNRVNRTETRDTFLRAIEPLRAKDTSRGGQWTIVRMLYATGDDADASAANTLAEKLRKDWDHSEPSSPAKWRRIAVANPDTTRPIDMDEGTQQFNDLNPNTILQSMGQGKEDYIFREFLPVACRFAPLAAINKTRDILEGLVTRTGFPLRQVILNNEDHLPLVDSEIAKNLIDRMQESNAYESLPEQDQSVCQHFSFYYAAAQISAEEQLRCMTGKITGSNYLLSVIPSLKPQPTKRIVTVVQDALQRNDEDAAYGALVAALYGHTQINDELEELILMCSRRGSSKLRALAFELAMHRSLNRVRKTHAHSKWSAASVDEKTYESWFGSMLLIEAGARDEISTDDFLNRISHQTWFTAVDRLGTALTKLFIHLFLQQLHKGIVAAGKIQPPNADLQFSRTEPVPVPLLSIEEANREDERFSKQKSLREILDPDDNFDEKQSRLKAAVDRFFEELKGSDAKFLIQEITIDSLQRLVVEVPTLLDELVVILEQADSTQFVWLRNLAFAVANLISSRSPEQAVILLNRACSSQGFVTLALEDDLTLEHQAIWGSTASAPMEALWRRRLLDSKSDAYLAREVLAAERFRYLST